MTARLRVLIEQPTRSMRWVAVATDWPGLERGGKAEDEALLAGRGIRQPAWRRRVSAERLGHGDQNVRRDMDFPDVGVSWSRGPR
jgi:hypothetical protein